MWNFNLTDLSKFLHRFSADGINGPNFSIFFRRYPAWLNYHPGKVNSSIATRRMIPRLTGKNYTECSEHINYRGETSEGFLWVARRVHHNIFTIKFSMLTNFNFAVDKSRPRGSVVLMTTIFILGEILPSKT